MGSSVNGEFTRWGVEEMGISADVKFTRWGVQEMGFSKHIVAQIQLLRSNLFRFGDNFLRYGVKTRTDQNGPKHILAQI